MALFHTFQRIVASGVRLHRYTRRTSIWAVGVQGYRGIALQSLVTCVPFPELVYKILIATIDGCRLPDVAYVVLCYCTASYMESSASKKVPI